MKSSRYFGLVLASIFHFLTHSCGEPLQGHKIAAALPDEFPFVVSFGDKIPGCAYHRSHFCTGTLITSKHVLTAKHCIANKYPRNVQVVVGVTNWKTAKLKYDVETWVSYDTWLAHYREPITSAHQLANDVAVVRLSSLVNQTGVVPAVLTDLNKLQLHRTDAVIVGWGVTNDSRPTGALQKATVKILTDAQCERRVKLISNQSMKMAETTLCSAAERHVLLTPGDSGGPLLDNNNALIGVHCSTCPEFLYWGHFTDAFRDQYKINIHTSVHYYREFIANVTSF